MKQTILIILLALVLTACGASNPGAPTDSTSVPNAYATALAAPNNTATTGVRPSNSGAATATVSGGGTEVAATPIESSTPVVAVTAPATAAITARPRPRPTATATGPLIFTGTGIYVANCRLATTIDKPGNVIVQISIEVTGGNGVYQYFDNDGKLWPTKFIDVPGERGTASIGKVKVTSGDGQTIEKEYYIQPIDLKCS